MSDLQDRVKQRRDYLKKKGWAYARATLAALLAPPCALIATALLVSSIFCVSQDRMLAYFLLSSTSVMGAIGASYLIEVVNQATQEVAQLPYVPPVPLHVQHTDAVLLRGSQQSTQEQSSYLLRGAKSDQDTVEQELLRGSQDQK